MNHHAFALAFMPGAVQLCIAPEIELNWTPNSYALFLSSRPGSRRRMQVIRQ